MQTNKNKKNGSKANTAASDSAAKKVNGLTSATEQNKSTDGNLSSKTDNNGAVNGTASKPRRRVRKAKAKIKIAANVNFDKIISGSNDFLGSQYQLFYADMIASGLFPNPALTLRRLNETVNEFTRFPKWPAYNTNVLFKKLDKDGFDDKQRIFIYEWISKIFDQMKLDDGTQFKEVAVIFQSHATSLKKKYAPTHLSLAEKIEKLTSEQLEKAPQLLTELRPAKQADFLIKLMKLTPVKTESMSSLLPLVNQLLKTTGNIYFKMLDQKDGKSE